MVYIPVSDETTRLVAAPDARQTDIFYEASSYSAFPQVVRLDGDELLLSFRQAPREEVIRHTHPRSVGVVVRSYDLGVHWDVAGATLLGSGGSGDLAMLYLGNGVVAGSLAKHKVVPRNEAPRAGLTPHPHEYPFALEGGYWLWSDNWGLTWPLTNIALISAASMPCCTPCRTQDGSILVPAYGTNEQAHTCSALLHYAGPDLRSFSRCTVMALGSPETREYYEPTLAELEPGHLCALHRVGRVKVGAGNTFWANESFDGGATWSEPVDSGIISGACPSLLRLSDGRLLVTFGRRQEPFGIRAMLSSDGGKSWGNTAYIIREARNWDQGYTSSVELGGGRVLTVTYMQNAEGVTGIVGTFWKLP